MTGRKDDGGKPDPTLTPPLAEREVWRVLTYGARHYAPENWRSVPYARHRYTAAALRHVNAHRCGMNTDAESGLHHLAHAVASLMFVLELELGGSNGGRSDGMGGAGPDHEAAE